MKATYALHVQKPVKMPSQPPEMLMFVRSKGRAIPQMIVQIHQQPWPVGGLEVTKSFTLPDSWQNHPPRTYTGWWFGCHFLFSQLTNNHN